MANGTDDKKLPIGDKQTLFFLTLTFFDNVHGVKKITHGKDQELVLFDFFLSQ